MAATLHSPAPPPVDYFAAADALTGAPAAHFGTPPFATLTATPRVLDTYLLLTAREALSHHDPAMQDKSNGQLFHRNKHLLTALPEEAVSPDIVRALCRAHPVPEDIGFLFEGLSAGEFVAVCLVRGFLDLYNGWNEGEGVGVFSGVARYERLESRLTQAATSAMTLRHLWNGLTHKLQAPLASGDHDRPLLTLFALPRALQSQTLRVCATQAQSAVMLARTWHGEAKAQSAAYADKAKRPQAAPSIPLPEGALLPVAEASGTVAVQDVPAVSGNSLRHVSVRASGWRHLSARLGLHRGAMGQGEIAAGTEALFVNGGNIAAGAKPPSDPFGLAAEVRAAHPLLDLLGGCTDSFMLGESRLKASTWLVCRENAAALAGTPGADLPALGVSAYDLLDDVTEVRTVTERGQGQMIHSFETLCAGTQLLLRLTLPMHTGPLTQGALAAAVETYLSELPTVGGQKARGYGLVDGRLLTCFDGWEERQPEYEHYLDDHRDALREGMVKGTLGARTVVVT